MISVSRKSLACFRTRRLFAQSALVVRVRSMQKRSAGLMKGSQTSSWAAGRAPMRAPPAARARMQPALREGGGGGGGVSWVRPKLAALTKLVLTPTPT